MVDQRREKRPDRPDDRRQSNPEARVEPRRDAGAGQGPSAEDSNSNEARLRLLLELARLGTFDFNPLTGEFVWSDLMRRHFGLPANAPVGYSVFLEGLYPEDRERVDQAVREALKPESGGRFACAFRTQGIRDKQIRMIESWGQVFFDARGQPTRLIGTTQDITERKQIEQRLRESEEQLRLVVESAPNAMVMADARGRIVLANAQAEKLFGYSRQEMMGQLVEMLVPERFRGKHPEYRRGFMADPRARPMGAGRDLFGLRKDGTEVPVEIGLNPIKTDEGVAVLASIVDITERKRAEETLRRQADLLEQTYDAVFVWELDGRIVYWNRGAEQLYGYARREAVDRVPRELLKTVLPPGVADFMEPLLMTGQWSGELFHRTADGRQIVVESRLVLVRYGPGRPYVLETTRDITQRKRTERQLKRLNETLERRVAERTAELRALAAELSQAEQRERHRLARVLHDQLQQLLVGAKFNLNILQGQLVREEMRQVARQVDRLLDESLDTSRSLTVELSPPILYQGNMSQALHWLGRWMREKHGLEVQVQADEQVNPQAEEVRILVFQAVRELLFNVVKHAKVSSASVEMTQLNMEAARIVVADEGVGFDPVKSKALKQHGSGFGLLSIQERLRWMGGQLDIDSAPGRGTRVTLLAPVQPLPQVMEDAEATAQQTGRAADAAAAGEPVEEPRKIRVLLADDHAVVRDGLARLLQMQPGIEVAGQASDGQQAVQMASALRPDVILMDVSMPVLNGMEATRRIHEELPKVLVIGLSMHTEEDVAAAMAAAGARAYLTKTLPPDVLVQTIRTCVLEATG